jgi:signal transduction histidine kinase
LNIHHLARQAYQQGELRMRQTAQSLEYVAGTLHVTNGKLLQHIRRIYPHIDNESYYKQAMTAHDQVYRLAESLHPIAWRERGLPAALHETVGRVLDEAGIIYSCQIMGRGFTRIQPSVLAAAYRAVCEALVYVCARMSCSSIRVTLRGGETNGARWLFVGVKGSMDDMKVVRAIHHATDRQRIAAKLGAHGLDLGELRDHVRLFDGDLHHRAGHEEVSVSMLLHDAKTVGERRDGAATPLRLWVQ